MGNRIYNASSVSGNRRFVVDISGGLPVILCEVNPANGSITNKYYYANAQILRQDNAEGSFYYVHDRLGSVRLVVDDSGDVKNSYTYNPFGEDLAAECTEGTENRFKFTGQWYDSEINQYYLRARQYDPQIMRFTARDPVKGKPTTPLSVHPYLYCLNDTINDIDPSGELSAGYLTEIIQAGYEAHYGAIGVTAYGISIGSDAMISLGIAMDQSVGAVMAIAAISRSRGSDDVGNMINRHKQQYWDNQMGNLNFNMPPGWGKGAKWAAAIGIGTLYLAHEWDDFIGMLKELKHDFDEWRNPQEWVPSPDSP